MVRKHACVNFVTFRKSESLCESLRVWENACYELGCTLLSWGRQSSQKCYPTFFLSLSDPVTNCGCFMVYGISIPNKENGWRFSHLLVIPIPPPICFHLYVFLFDTGGADKHLEVCRKCQIMFPPMKLLQKPFTISFLFVFT